MDIERILIANRGEIAVRVIRACRELGIEAVAVYEAEDRDPLHVELADDARPVPSYLDGDALIEAAAGCDALHPGYGYLSESPEFASAVARAGIVWIGPPAAAMRALGDKVEARRLAEAAGVPVVPGYAGLALDDETLLREGLRLGTPLLVKAAAGGGGRGMRAVDDLGELGEAIEAARREAKAAFGDDRVFLERRLAAAHHVEVQILCDAHGGAVHLGERDCSLQRRHQKIVEESPSPAVDDDLRAALGDAALRVARAAGYVGAGTAEFLLSEDGTWAFLELNARLQVEHAVTELVSTIDLVRAQIDIAAGRPLELEQDDVLLRGHALECRLYAEDPANGFLPATGTLVRFSLPHWPGVRCDSGVREGDRVGVRYDPMLAKLVAHAEDRDACIDRMAAALADTVVLGVTTNLGFLRWVLEHPAVRAGEATTDLVEREWHAGLVPAFPGGVAPGGADVWHAYGTAAVPAGVLVSGSHALHLGWAHTLAGGDDDRQAARAVPAGSLAAPMPATVLRVAVSEGDGVTTGQPLVILEAMKMELTVSAPADGAVGAVHVSPGQLVEAGQTLVELE
jgi:3-methylcrotonyl-CoA carboxylase alpha subunit